MPFSLSHFLGALAADPPGQLDVLWHDGHALGVDGAQVGVLEQADQVGLGRFLEGLRTHGLVNVNVYSKDTIHINEACCSQS